MSSSQSNKSYPNTNEGSELIPRGFTFVILEQLPDVDSGKLIRKVGIVEYNTTLKGGIPSPSNQSLQSLAGHALGNKPSQYLSFSGSPLGSPTNVLEGAPPGKPVLVDIKALKRAGVTIHSTQDVIADLQKMINTNPNSARRIGKLIDMIRSVEFEVLTQGDIPPHAVTKVNSLHQRYISSAEQIMRDYKYKHSDWGRARGELAQLHKQYRQGRVTGSVFRVVTVVGVVFTAYDMTRAANKSVQTNSAKPVVAESIRQVGGWGAGWVGFKTGCFLGGLAGIETGPGAIATCLIGAVSFGYAGYKGADWVADYIDEN